MKLAVILPAAGVGKRFTGSSTAVEDLGKLSKIEMDLAGLPVFLRAVELFVKRDDVDECVLAVNPDTYDEFKFRWGDKLGFHRAKLVKGGTAERWETVLNALEAIDEGATHIAVHDAARPLASRKLIDRVLEAAGSYDAVIPGLPVPNTLKRVSEEEDSATSADPLDDILGGGTTVKANRVVETVDRTGVVEVQTPQVFKRDLLERAYAQIKDGSLDPKGITDDASLIEALGEPVHVVEGESTNFKITRAEDLELAGAIVHKRLKQEKKDLGKKRLFGPG